MRFTVTGEWSRNRLLRLILFLFRILAKAVRLGYDIRQLPVTHYPRTAGEQSGASLRVIGGEETDVTVTSDVAGRYAATNLSEGVYAVIPIEAPCALSPAFQAVTVGKGQMVFTPPMVDHAMYFPEDTKFVTLSRNPRSQQAYEADVVRIASGHRTPAAVLARLAADRRWGARRAVGLALAGNPRTPTQAALRAVARLPPGDLRRLLSDANVPTIVRVGAERRVGGAVVRGPT